MFAFIASDFFFSSILVLHFYSGRPLCRLTMNKGSVHVDMNGDGVIGMK